MVSSRLRTSAARFAPASSVSRHALPRGRNCLIRLPALAARPRFESFDGRGGAAFFRLSGLSFRNLMRTSATWARVCRLMHFRVAGFPVTRRRSACNRYLIRGLLHLNSGRYTIAYEDSRRYQRGDRGPAQGPRPSGGFFGGDS
jgi:hypothetical protein